MAKNHSSKDDIRSKKIIFEVNKTMFEVNKTMFKVNRTIFEVNKTIYAVNRMTFVVNRRRDPQLFVGDDRFEVGTSLPRFRLHRRWNSDATRWIIN